MVDFLALLFILGFGGDDEITNLPSESSEDSSDLLSSFKIGGLISLTTFGLLIGEPPVESSESSSDIYSFDLNCESVLEDVFLALVWVILLVAAGAAGFLSVALSF